MIFFLLIIIFICINKILYSTLAVSHMNQYADYFLNHVNIIYETCILFCMSAPQVGSYLKIC